MSKLPKVFFLIFAIGFLSISCGLTDLAADVFSRFPTSTPGLGEPVLAPLDLYVSMTGVDTNNCLSETLACRTLYRAFVISTPNSIIHIGPGEFIEEQLIYTRYGLTLIGRGVDQTVIRSNVDVDGYDYILMAGTGGPVIIRDLAIVGHGAEDVDAGIEVVDGGNVTLENCRVADIRIGILIHPGGMAAINNCVVSVNTFGVQNDGNLEMSATQLRESSDGALWNTGSANITDITFYNNGSVDEADLPLIVNNSGQLNIYSSTISGNNGTAVFNIGDLVLDHVAIRNNNNIGERQSGIQTLRGEVTILSNVIQNNSSYGIKVAGGNVGIQETAIVNNNKGGLYINGGSVIVQNTTITTNGSFIPNGTGGITNTAGDLELINSTIILNSGPGVIVSSGAHIGLRSSVIAANVMSVQCFGFSSSFSSADFNIGCDETLTFTSLGFGPLTEEDGTLFYPLLSGSPLINTGPNAGYLCPAIDQRGAVRPVGVKCDIGAYESSSVIAALEYVTPSSGETGVVPLFTSTPTPSAPIILTFTGDSYCRMGPGSLYRSIAGFKLGETTRVDGRNAQNPRWWWVLSPNGKEHCWISYITVEKNDLAESLPIQPVSLILPTTPSSFVISKRNCSANGYSLQLAWTTSNNADGFTLYRNGVVIATFNAQQTEYQEIPPTNKSLRYELEAFNKYGFSNKLLIEDHCP
jgi:hypothetical protein